MSLLRSLQPEWLDALPTFDSGAIGSRADLAWLNKLMFQAEILHRILAKHCAGKNPLSILELGAGDGTFMLRLARKFCAHTPGAAVTLLDRRSLVTQKTLDGFADCGWKATPIEADALAFLEGPAVASVDVITANLFLHHLSEATLARLFCRAAQLARLFVACEPGRNRFALFSSRMLWAVGCNNVTLHDAPASVHAGFSGHELSALWPQNDGWQVSEYAFGPFTHCFVARHADRG